MPTVSVIIPTFNRAVLVTRAVESVLGQTLPADEVIVIDDGSTDDTRDVLTRFGNRIRYVFQENQGVSAARNRGIEAATGRYIAFLDSDDEWLPLKLERQVAHLESHPEIDFVTCRDSTDDGQLKTETYRDPRHQLRQFLIRPFYSNPSRYLVRRECFEEFGRFDPRFPPAEDLEMWLRLLKAGCRFDILSEPLMIYHLTPGALSCDPRRAFRGELLVREHYVRTLPARWDRWIVGSLFTARMHLTAARGLRTQGHLAEAGLHMLRSLTANPFGPQSHRRLQWLASFAVQWLRSETT
ncbi:MAG: glycosyltransferase [Planctomycetales bacterium]|nr:glycosyltransferase [Planctomycetales bacterium]